MEEPLVEQELTQEEDSQLFHTKNRLFITKVILPDDTLREVHTGNWCYVNHLEISRVNEKEPDIIVAFYENFYKEKFVEIRLAHTTPSQPKMLKIPLAEFIERLENGSIVMLDMPMYRYGERFINKFNQEKLVIRDVPRSKNELDGEFTYYVRTYSPRDGYNYRSIKESEITEFFRTEGVIKR